MPFRDLQGKDATPGVICYSNPKFIPVLADWLVLWACTPGVHEVDVWMAEDMYGKTSCQCDACKKEDRSVLETAVILKAWQRARAGAGPGPARAHERGHREAATCASSRCCRPR